MTDEQLGGLIHSMTIDEKVNQLSQLPPTFYNRAEQIPGTEVNESISREQMNQMGSILYITDYAASKEVQDTVMRFQPHKIPLLFMMDVIHGFKTIFPIPLAQAASFHPDLISQCAEAAAAEASAAGIDVVFSPMVDLARDARWGRVMESAGEDPFLNCEMGKAMIRGYQKNHKTGGYMSACFKHFAAYGGAEGGRDYNTVELSEHTLRSFYLPAYEEAVREGCDMAMTSFNTLNGLPSSGNPWLLTKILREEWGFEGVVISDWNAIGELAEHGVCKDLKEAALTAFLAGVDIDMCSFAYAKHLAELVVEGKVTETALDRSVLRVLKLKNKHGLFENPYKNASSENEAVSHLSEAHRNLARQAVRESIVLLKNCGEVPLLPIQKGTKAAFIGPFVRSGFLLSAWAPNGDEADTVTVFQAAEEIKSHYSFSYAQGCILNTRDDYQPQSDETSIQAIREGIPVNLNLAGDQAERLLAEAASVAAEAETVIVCIGEHPRMSGEGASRGNISIPQPQMELLKRLWEVNRNVVAVVFAGRPLDLRDVSRYSKAILYAWLPGTEGGHGLMDILTGECCPSGKLTMSIPYSIGQIPVYYNSYQTGRPKSSDPRQAFYTSAYNDIPNAPLFPFGYGLSYTKFAYGPVHLSAEAMTVEERIEVGATVTNTGHCKGTEVVQMYIRDLVGSTVRPRRMLKGFRKVTLEPGESCYVTFQIDEKMLTIYNSNMELVSEPGRFEIYIGTDSDTENKAQFSLLKRGEEGWK